MLDSVFATTFMSWDKLEYYVTPGIQLIDGWNEDDGRSEGSGKSAVVNALCWGGYGKLPKDAGIDEVIKDGASSCKVIINFKGGDKIVRGRKPNELYLFKDGQVIKGKDAKETQLLIEEYLGCNFETFCQSVYFAQNYDKKFLSSNQEDKGKILSSIQNLQIFDKARKEAADLAKIEEAKLTKLKAELQVQSNVIANANTQIALIKSFINDKIEKHKSQERSILTQKNMVLGNIKQTEAKLEQVKISLASLDPNKNAQDEQELLTLQSDFNTKLAVLKTQKNQIDQHQKELRDKEAEGQLLANKYSALEIKLNATVDTDATYLRFFADRDRQGQFATTARYTNLAAKQAKLVAFIANPTGTCPSCGTELKDMDTSHSQAELAEIDAELSKIAADSELSIQELDRKIDAYQKAFDQDMNFKRQELDQILVKLNTISEYLDNAKVMTAESLLAEETEYTNTLLEITQALRQVAQIKVEFSTLSGQLQNLQTTLSNYDQQVAQYDLSLQQLGEPDITQDQQRLTTLTEESAFASIRLDELNNLTTATAKHIQSLESLKDGFKEIKSYVFTNALTELNYRTNKYLSELFDMEASITFSNEDQKIESTIMLGGVSRGLGLLSGGQSRRFNLAVDLALADIVSYRRTSKLDLLVFDEYFKDLSEISMEKSLDLLKSRKSPVILIEHNSLFKSIIDNTFYVKLVGGTSNAVESL